MKTALVTGGAGFLGSNLCKRLLNEGYYVICVDNFYTGRKENIIESLDNENFHFIKKDIRQEINIDENIDIKENRFGFEPEITAKISKMDVNLIEIPISYFPRNKEEGKKIKLKDGFRALYCILKYNICE